MRDRDPTPSVVDGCPGESLPLHSASSCPLFPPPPRSRSTLSSPITLSHGGPFTSAACMWFLLIRNQASAAKATSMTRSGLLTPSLQMTIRHTCDRELQEQIWIPPW
ncbi:unnamed protein product [Linum trigynum]|uniref:Uncharacterized protein n=1 Tax=Linum trigynum TaxID=586398 RepID=A0AAV2DDJ9_9ROSI